ncbi:unnamed protein product, partial [Allacma fusca]
MESTLERSASTSENLVKFDNIQPLCCDVMKNPSEEHLMTLWNFLENTVSLHLSPDIANYIIFPLVIHLKTSNRLTSKAKEILVKCIETILSKSVPENHQIFTELFQNFSVLLGTKNNQPVFELNMDLPEEQVMSVEVCMLFLLKELTPSRKDILYEERTISSVGHCIFMQLQIVNSDLALEIRLEALEIIERLFTATTGNPSFTHRLFSFIPGVAVALRKAASSRVGRPRKSLICKSLDVLNSCLVVSLEYEPQKSLEKVDLNLSILIQALSNDLVSHEEEEIRLSLLRLSISLISSCDQKLPKCCEILWSNIYIQRWDIGSEKIRQSSQLFLQSRKDEVTNFEESLKILKKSYSQLISNNVEESEMNLKLLASHLLQNNLLFVEIALLLPPLVKLFTVAILQNRLSTRTDHDVRLFAQNSFTLICHQLCEVIKETTTPNDIVEEIIPFLSLNSAIVFNERLENNLIGALFFFNNIMVSYLKDTHLLEELQSLDLPNIASLYLEILNFQVTDIRDATPKVSAALDCEIVLLIEGLGTVASIDSRVVLPLVLYYLLEQAGSTSVSVATTAEQALQKIGSTHSRIETDFQTTVQDNFQAEDFATENEVASDEKKCMGPELNLVLSICHRVLNFLSNKSDRGIQISSLDCLIYGVQLLDQQENELLPLAHTIWQNLMPRFGDNDLNVVRKSFELLLILGKCSRTFMRKRIVAEVFPKLSSLLAVLSGESERFHRKDTLYYTLTQSYKLQAVLLEGLAELCLCIELNEEELDQVVSGCLVYLKPRQHKNLM